MNQRQMAKFLIDEEVANAILEYLSRQPYREVYKIMVALSELQELPPQALSLLAEHITANTSGTESVSPSLSEDI